MVSTTSVDASCHECGAPVVTLAWIAQTRPHLVKCDQHRQRATVTDEGVDAAPRASELFRRAIPADCREVTLSGIHDDALREALTSWSQTGSAPTGGCAFVVLGPAGTGKSGACWAALAQAVQAGVLRPNDILAGTEQALMEPMGVRSQYTGRADSWDKRLTGQRVVFVDDVGYALFPDANTRVSVWKDLLDRVSARSLTLMLSSNVASPKELATILAPASTSRLRLLTSRGGMFTAGTSDRRTGQQYGTGQVAHG